MHSLRLPRRNTEDIKVGPLRLPLPWLIPICIFSPFFLSFLLWAFYRHMFKRYQNKRNTADQAAGLQVESEDVEMQSRVSMKKPKEVLLTPQSCRI
jgi:hypothetical protein